MNNWLKFCIPTYYLFYSRLKRKSEIFSWVLVFPLVVFLGNYSLTDLHFLPFVALFVFAYWSWFSFYEIGYLENDALTVKFEDKPTMRIPVDEVAFIQKYFRWIALLRWFSFFLGLALLYIFFESQVRLDWMLLLAILTRAFFWIHNHFRSRINIFSYFGLSTCKYLFLSLVLYGFTYPFLLLGFFLAFPLVRTIEHACKVKYQLTWLKKWVGELDNFRVRYYLMISLMLLVYLYSLHTLDQLEKQYVVMFGLVLYFTIFRIFVWIVLKYGQYKRTKFEAHTWEK